MRWEPPTASESDSETREYYKWVLCSAYPELDMNNQVLEIVGNVTDISKQKWAEDVQKRRTDSALESKQHLEHFIDTTSHEMSTISHPSPVILQTHKHRESVVSHNAMCGRHTYILSRKRS